MQQKGASETLQKKGRWSFQIGRHITGLHHLHISNKIGSRMPPTRSHFGYFSDRTLIPKNQDKKVELLAAGGSKGQFKAATHSPQPNIDIIEKNLIPKIRTQLEQLKIVAASSWWK